MYIQLLINGISLGSLYAIIAVGFALIFSILKFSNLALGGVIGLTAYVAFFFQDSIVPRPHIFVTMLVAAVVGMVIMLLVDLIGFRQVRRKDSPRIYYFLMSITVGIMIESGVTIAFGARNYGFPPIFDVMSFRLGGFVFSTTDMTVMAVSILLLVALVLLINKTKLGRAMRAVAIDTNTSKLMGINSGKIIMISFVMAGALAGVAAVFLAIRFSVFPELGSRMIIKGLMASVVGGLGSMPGAIIGAFALGTLEMFLIFFLGSSIAPVILLAVFLCFLLVRPQGISGKIIQDKA